MCIYHILFIHSSIDGHLGCFYFLGIVNNASMNMGEQISQDTASSSFGYISKTGTSRSYGSPIFNFLRNHSTASIAVTPFYISTSAQGSNFSTA